MSNLFFNAQQAANNKSFRYNKMDGLNKKGNARSKIHVVGQIDNFTLRTLYENYDVIAQNLKVYPTIKIHPRGSTLEGNFSGLYHASDNHIDIIDNYYIISIVAHEMRHAYQYIYFPDLYFNSAYNSAQGYLDCDVERDAREYARDYCTARGYREELEHLIEDEKQIESIINNKVSPAERGLSNEYFRANPTVAYTVPRNYHLNRQEYEVDSSKPVMTRVKRKIRWWRAIGNILVVVAIVYGLIWINGEDDDQVSVTETENHNEEAETIASTIESKENNESEANGANTAESDTNSESDGNAVVDPESETAGIREEDTTVVAETNNDNENTATTAESVTLEEQLIASALQYFDDIGGDSSQLSLYETSWDTEYYDGTYFVMPFSDGNRITTILGDESGKIYFEGETLGNGKISATPVE
ncbi:hypothetical protein SFC66_04105 [Terribacillus saccharophilus]|uniref:hypothetical protein n=1 Tax=Terribacillus saccharophilus TaxID=361277 RepID=UPI003981C3A4